MSGEIKDKIPTKYIHVFWASFLAKPYRGLELKTKYLRLILSLKQNACKRSVLKILKKNRTTRSIQRPQTPPRR